MIAVSTLIGMLINFGGVNPISALFWTAVINGFLAPPMLIIIMFVANNKAVLGPNVNGLAMNVMGWLTTLVILTAAAALIVIWSSSH